ncbi:MAG: glycosyltransferase family 1 protein, partial [ANME-2 cluster archaeon]
HKVCVFTPNDNNTLKTQEKVDNIEVYRPLDISNLDTFRHFSSNEIYCQWGDEGISFLCDLFSYNHISAYLLTDLIGREHVDVCVAHDWLGLPAALAAKRTTGIPIIYHVHSTEVGRSLGCANSQVVSYELLGTELADIVITVSNAMKEELISIGAKPEKIHVCYNGIDAEKFDPARIDNMMLSTLKKEYNISSDDKVILFLGRLEQVKGADKLVQAMPAILRQNPKAKLVIVGSGTYEGLIRDHIAHYDLEGSVYLNTEFLDDVSKMHHYFMADVCVFPSLYEPFGIVALEAMAMEKPLVVGAKGVSGLREIVITPPSKKTTGMHVDPYDPEDIAWGVNTLLNDLDMAREWGKNGRQRVLDTFTWNIIAANTLDIYGEVMNV